MGRDVGGGSGLGTSVHPWRIHVDVWQNQYSIVKYSRVKKKKKYIKKNQESYRTSTFDLLTTPKPLTMWITTNCGKFLKRWEYQTSLPTS